MLQSIRVALALLAALGLIAPRVFPSTSASPATMIEINRRGTSSWITDLTSFQGAVFFLRGAEPWRSDGTSTGTVLVKPSPHTLGPAIYTRKATRLTVCPPT